MKMSGILPMPGIQVHWISEDLYSPESISAARVSGSSVRAANTNTRNDVRYGDVTMLSVAAIHCGQTNAAKKRKT